MKLGISASSWQSMAEWDMNMDINMNMDMGMNMEMIPYEYGVYNIKCPDVR